MFFDPMYLIFMAPAILLALWAQVRVKSAFHHGNQYQPRSGLSGAETAQRILDTYQLHDVTIEPVNSFLGDHYDPRNKVLRLSPDVYNGRTLSALGIAAHEVGHAIQHAHSYGPLAVRNSLVPVAAVGTNLAWIFIIAGLALAPFRALAIVGLALFAAGVLFSIITLPVEYDASKRARAILLNNGMVTTDEDRVVGKVLNAAALTYVAAAIGALLQLAYWALIVFGRRN
ncbi:MAG: zinc metallopeptidase [Phycisphaerae bacterium]|nr:MAG: zinc metallopeptidase [Planctomycetia bacterium]RIK66865.1 MAG: zinc metallopeptidase [Planctomycetota bacterium]GJQ27005.1 MAG: zinc metallopeptidase [Phycisphaerae bacterium]